MTTAILKRALEATKEAIAPHQPHAFPTEAEAAARYTRMLDHHLPIEERRARALQLSQGAPVVRRARRPR